MEKYSLRANFGRFKTDLQICKSLIETFLNLEDRHFNKDLELLLDLHQRFIYVADMCKQQSLNTVGRINPVIAVNACSNLIATVKTEYLEEPNSEHIKPLLEKVVRTVDNVVSNIETKMVSLSIERLENPVEEVVEEQPAMLAPDCSYEEFSETAKRMLGNFERTETSPEKPRDGDDLFYEKLNTQLAGERDQIALDIEDLKTNDYKIVRGSVSIHHFFRPEAIKHVRHSVVNFNSINYNRHKKEVIAPIHVFHDQLLVAIKLKPQKFFFRKTPLSVKERAERKDQSFNALRQESETALYFSKGALINFSNRFVNPYLVAKAFPGIRFMWFVDSAFESALHQIKDGSVALMWD